MSFIDSPAPRTFFLQSDALRNENESATTRGLRSRKEKVMIKGLYRDSRHRPADSRLWLPKRLRADRFGAAGARRSTRFSYGGLSTSNEAPAFGDRTFAVSPTKDASARPVSGTTCTATISRAQRGEALRVARRSGRLADTRTARSRTRARSTGPARSMDGGVIVIANTIAFEGMIVTSRDRLLHDRVSTYAPVLTACS